MALVVVAFRARGLQRVDLVAEHRRVDEEPERHRDGPQHDAAGDPERREAQLADEHHRHAGHSEQDVGGVGEPVIESLDAMEYE